MFESLGLGDYEVRTLVTPLLGVRHLLHDSAYSEVHL
jgi:hypothetical protein